MNNCSLFFACEISNCRRWRNHIGVVDLGQKKGHSRFPAAQRDQISVQGISSAVFRIVSRICGDVWKPWRCSSSSTGLDGGNVSRTPGISSTPNGPVKALPGWLATPGAGNSCNRATRPGVSGAQSLYQMACVHQLNICCCCCCCCPCPCCCCCCCCCCPCPCCCCCCCCCGPCC